MSETLPKRPSRWVIAIVVAFALVFVANAILIYVAVSGADTVVPSYHTEHR